MAMPDTTQKQIGMFHRASRLSTLLMMNQRLNVYSREFLESLPDDQIDQYQEDLRQKWNASLENQKAVA